MKQLPVNKDEERVLPMTVALLPHQWAHLADTAKAREISIARVLREIVAAWEESQGFGQD